MVFVSGCAPTVGPLGPNPEAVRAKPPPAYKVVPGGPCEWGGTAFRCPPGTPLTVQVPKEEDAQPVMWRHCPTGFLVQREEDVALGSTSIASTYRSGGPMDPLGPLMGRKERTYTETTLVTDKKVTFSCRSTTARPATEVECASSDVRSCVRKGAPESGLLQR
jgi:hypothetical protein